MVFVSNPGQCVIIEWVIYRQLFFFLSYLQFFNFLLQVFVAAFQIFIFFSNCPGPLHHVFGRLVAKRVRMHRIFLMDRFFRQSWLSEEVASLAVCLLLKTLGGVCQLFRRSQVTHNDVIQIDDNIELVILERLQGTLHIPIFTIPLSLDRLEFQYLGT